MLRWSKSHGWVNPLDFFLFPNFPPANIGLGSPLDSSQMSRLAWTAIAQGLRKADLYTKYTPSNEWIWVQKYGMLYDDYSRITTHDSVIAFQAIDSVSGLATMRTIKVYWQFHFPTGPRYQPYTTTTLSVSTHTDTVRAAFDLGTF